MPDDFCVEHGYEFMKSQMGNPIPYCSVCEEHRATARAIRGPSPRTISERGRALILAAAVLDRPNADPDDDIAILARQLGRAQEEIDSLQRAVCPACNGDKVVQPIGEGCEECNGTGRVDPSPPKTCTKIGLVQRLAKSPILEFDEDPEDGFIALDISPAERDMIVSAFGALEQIADIAEGSETVNSLPHIAKIARGVTAAQTSAQASAQ